MTDSPFRLPDHPAASDPSDERSDQTDPTTVPRGDTPADDDADRPDPPVTSPQPPPWWRADPTGTTDGPSASESSPAPSSELPPIVPAPAVAPPAFEPAAFEPAAFEPAPFEPAPFEPMLTPRRDADEREAEVDAAPERQPADDDLWSRPVGPAAAPTETFRPVAPITPAPLTPVPRVGGPRPAPPRSSLAPPPRSAIPPAARVPRLGGGAVGRHGRDLPRRGRAAFALLSVSIVMGVLVAMAVTLILFLAGAALQRALG